MLCQNCRRYLNSKRPGNTVYVERYSCPICIGLETYFPKIRRLKRKYYETWPDWQVWVDVRSITIYEGDPLAKPRLHQLSFYKRDALLSEV